MDSEEGGAYRLNASDTTAWGVLSRFSFQDCYVSPPAAASAAGLARLPTCLTNDQRGPRWWARQKEQVPPFPGVP